MPRTIAWNEMDLLSVVQWWHDGASLSQIGLFMNISPGTAKTILHKIADVYGLQTIVELRALYPQDVIDRYMKVEKLTAAAEEKKSGDKAIYRRNRRFLARLTLHHDVMFNGQPVPPEAKEKARIAIREVA